MALYTGLNIPMCNTIMSSGHDFSITMMVFVTLKFESIMYLSRVICILRLTLFSGVVYFKHNKWKRHGQLFSYIAKCELTNLV